MGIYSRLKSWLSPNQQPQPQLKAYYDQRKRARTDGDYWSQATNASHDFVISPSVRAEIRKKARYEYANNPWLQGIISTFVTSVIPDLPRIDLGDSPERDRVEAEWDEFCSRYQILEACQLLLQSRIVDGEGLLLFNYDFDSLPYTLLECDRITRYSPLPQQNPDGTTDFDGVLVSQNGAILSVYITDQHPGTIYTSAGEYYPASRLIFVYKRQRAEQYRGVSECVSVLGLAAYMRRYVDATIQAAEVAASIGGVLYTEQYSPFSTGAAPDPYDLVELPHRALLTLPPGWRISQLQAYHPQQQFDVLRLAIISEIARPFDLPVILAAADSSRANYSSARLDLQQFRRRVKRERAIFTVSVLAKLWELFLQYLQVNRFDVTLLQHVRPKWYWPGEEFIDPLKEANAILARLQAGVTSLADEIAATGRDYRDVLRRQRDVLELQRQLGLTPMNQQAQPPQQEIQQDEQDEDQINNTGRAPSAN